MPASEEPWKSIAAKKQQQREARIPKAWRLDASTISSNSNLLSIPSSCGILSKQEIEITETKDATCLLESLLSRKLKSEDVVIAFCKRAAIAQQLTNCLTEMFFDDAIKRAKELDQHMARTGKPKGPLHGLPISLKDTFKVKGYDASVGIAALCFKESTTNSPLADLLLNAGAVLYCKTNVPQTMMALDSHNNVFGRTINPLTPKLTAGGSSGGEGALLGIRGSILGVGTDIGGSIRIPAMANYLYGVKPSHGRVPIAGTEGGAKPGSEGVVVRGAAGPIAHSVRDCELFFRVMGDMKAWNFDPEVVPQPWQGHETLQLLPSSASPTSKPRPIRLGIVRTDGVTTPLPPISAFMDEVAARLSSHGGGSGVPPIEVIEMNLTSLLSQCQTVINGFFTTWGSNNWFDLLEETQEPLSPWLQNKIRRKAPHSLETLRDLHGRKTALQTEFLKVWQSNGGYWGRSLSGKPVPLDALICPVAPHPLPEIDRWNTASYTSSFVLLDCASATIPVRKMSHADLKGDIDTTQNALGSWDAANRKLWTNVDKNVYLDSPLCIQVVTQRLQERKLVEVMEVIDSALKAPGKRSTVGAKL